MKEVINEPYRELASIIEEAGFYCSHQGSECLYCVQSQIEAPASPTGYGLVGTNFAVANANGTWFILSRVPLFYRIADPKRVASLCLELLSTERVGAVVDFREEIKTKYGLIPVTEAEFDAAWT